MHRPILAGAANPTPGDAKAIHLLSFFDVVANMADAIWFAAHRENRRRERRRNRQVKNRGFISAGLNGARAVARRLRQIEAGQLQVTA